MTQSRSFRFRDKITAEGWGQSSILLFFWKMVSYTWSP